LVRQGSNAVRTLNNFLKEAKVEKKSRFVELIHEKIRNSFSLADEIEKLKDNSHEDILKLLFLFNVEYVRQLQTYGTNNLPDEYKQRFAFGLHNRETWSVEHIEAQEVEPFNKREHWELWIKDHCKALSNIQSKIEQNNYFPDKDEIIGSIKNINVVWEILEEKKYPSEESQQLSERILEVIEKLRSIDNTDVNEVKFEKFGLGNLALIDRSLNSHLNNSIFLVKQEKILKLINDGKYVPKSIEALFMRYFNNEAIFLPYWSSKDYANYIKQIKKTLNLFLKHENNDTLELTCRN
jgi:Txe/YoeB family toxin of Txe-Axe toxin-antitoxin module